MPNTDTLEAILREAFLKSPRNDNPNFELGDSAVWYEYSATWSEDRGDFQLRLHPQPVEILSVDGDVCNVQSLKNPNDTYDIEAALLWAEE